MQAHPPLGKEGSSLRCPHRAPQAGFTQPYSARGDSALVFLAESQHAPVCSCPPRLLPNPYTPPTEDMLNSDTCEAAADQELEMVWSRMEARLARQRNGID